MTGPAPGIPPGQPPREDLTTRLFQALYRDFELRTIGGTFVVVPRGVPCFAGHSLGDIARQISDYKNPGPATAPPGAPSDPIPGTAQ